MNYSLAIDGDFLFEKLSQIKERKNLILEVRDDSVSLRPVKSIEPKKEKTYSGTEGDIEKRKEIYKQIRGAFKDFDFDWDLNKAKDYCLQRQ